jgi:predicted permease
MSNAPELLELLERVFLTVFPLAVIVFIGFIYARKYETDMRIPNRLNMDIFLPALIFAVMASETFDLNTYAILSLGALVTVFGSGVISLPIARALGLSAKTFVPPMMFNNCGNLGLPLALLAFGELGLAAMMAMFLVSNTLHFTLGSYIVSGSASPRKILLNPMILATILGLIWNLLEIPFPEFIQLPLRMLGDIAIPLMLVSLGVRMNGIDLSNWKIGIYGALLSPLTSLVFAIPFALILGLSVEFTAYLVLFSAMPPAVLNYLVAERYNLNPNAVASIVMIGNMASLIIVPLTLFFII